MSLASVKRSKSLNAHVDSVIISCDFLHYNHLTVRKNRFHFPWCFMIYMCVFVYIYIQSIHLCWQSCSHLNEMRKKNQRSTVSSAPRAHGNSQDRSIADAVTTLRERLSQSSLPPYIHGYQHERRFCSIWHFKISQLVNHEGEFYEK